MLCFISAVLNFERLKKFLRIFSKTTGQGWPGEVIIVLRREYVQSSCCLYFASASLIIRLFEVHQTMISEVSALSMIMLHCRKGKLKNLGGWNDTLNGPGCGSIWRILDYLLVRWLFVSKKLLYWVAELRLNIIILTLFKTTIKGNFVLYRILQAYSMLDINVTGLVLLAVSIIYTTIVANDDASASVIMAPDADQVNTSIWPGVSNIAYLEYNTHNK